MIALNGYENTLEYKLEGNLFAYSADMLSGFSYYSESGELIEFTSEFIIPTLSKKRFLRVLEKGKYSLLAYQYILMVDDANGTYGSQSAKIFQNQLEFFIAKEGKVSLLKNKRKDLQAIFGEEAGMASSIIKDQKLNLKSEGDVKILIRQMNK